MRRTGFLLAVALLVATARSGMAACGASPGDAQALADARAQVEADCDCTGSPSHGAYVRCATQIARERASADLLPARCKGAVIRCAVRSTCGRPGLVACCVTRPGGTKCKRTEGAASCAAQGGAPSPCPSCCDACGGCVTTTTTTTLPPCESASTPACAGACPAGNDCADIGGNCACAPNGCTGGDGFPECNGTCPAGSTCFRPGFECTCVPDDCGGGQSCRCIRRVGDPGFLCDSGCPPGRVCRACEGISVCISPDPCTTIADCMPGEACFNVPVCFP